jgi:hypothetical protein
MPTSRHLNLRWSLKDIDDVQEMIRQRWDAKSIAEAFLTTEGEVLALCRRNNLPMPRASSRPPGQGA